MNRLWLGTATFGPWGNADRGECVAIIHRGLDAGIVAIDTADSYSDGAAEEIVGEALRGRRDDVYLATKVGYHTPGGGGRVDAEAIVASVEASLRRLNTDHVDLVQLHRFDPATGIEEVVTAFDRLLRDGKAGATGTSMFGPAALELARSAAEKAGVEPFSIEQAPYSILVRHIERGVLSACERLGIGLVTFAPINGGWLSGQYSSGVVPSASRAATWPVRRQRFDLARPEVRRKVDLVDRLEPIAAAAGCTLTQLAVAFPLANPQVQGVIVGARSLDQLEGLLPAADLQLDPVLLGRIDEVAAPGATVDPEDIAAYGDVGATD